MPTKPRRLLMISYQLGSPIIPETHAKIAAILQKSDAYAHYLSTTWLVASSRPIEELMNDITQQLGAKGRLLIFEVKRPYAGSLPSEAWKWLRHIFQVLDNENKPPPSKH